jgi:hypothetical protein
MLPFFTKMKEKKMCQKKKKRGDKGKTKKKKTNVVEKTIAAVCHRSQDNTGNEICPYECT